MNSLEAIKRHDTFFRINLVKANTLSLHPAIMDKPGYRPDIDGLRAIAVVAVVVNHLNPQLLPGGYLGVDIFFVISGFVITQSLLANKQSKGKEILATFYEKRIKRIAPALILNVAVVSLLSWAFQYDPVLSIKTGISSLGGFSNLYLITKATDYFAESSYSNFFLHTWSLGVEEQFYLIYPAFFVLSGIRSSASRKYFFGILVTLSIISFVLFTHWWETDNSIAYFNPISRAWEIFAGCIMFLIGSKNKFDLKHWNGVSITIFFGLLICLSSHIKSPVQYLIVVISTAVLVLPYKSSLIQKFLSLPLLSKTGKTSYSVYLWHWPAICLLVNFGLEKNNIAIALCIIIFSAISLFSYYLIEQPLRKTQWAANTAHTILVGTGATIVSLISLFTLHKFDIHKVMFVGKRYEKSIFASTSVGNSDCGLSPDEPYRFPACTVKINTFKVNNQTSKTKYSEIWILGDSQAAHLAPIASDLAKINNANVNIAAVYGAPFPPVRFIDTKRGTQDSRKRYELQKRVFTSIINKAKPKSAIIIYNSGSYNDTENKSDLFVNEDWLSTSRNSQYSSQYKDKILGLLKSSRGKDLTTIIITPTPRFNNYSWMQCTQWFSSRNISCSQIANSHSKSDQQAVDMLLKLSKESKGLIKTLNSRSALCKDQNCNTKLNGNLLYHDGVHLTPLGAQLLSKKVSDSLKDGI